MSGQEADAVRRPRTGKRGLLRLVLPIVLTLLALLAVGFVRFSGQVAVVTETPEVDAADGIVVFTGGSGRIRRAIELLRAGKARRLLISGVYPATTEDILRQRTAGARALFDCCIDLGHEALDTRGNAAETAEWAKTHDISSLIVVTSSYHMPRSLAELAHASPDVALTPYAFLADGLDLHHWWEHPDAIRLLAAEYLKYLAAIVRLELIDGRADRALAD